MSADDTSREHNIAAPIARDVCDLIASACSKKLEGTLFGSAYRKHPKFIFRRNILICNEWNTHDYCYAEAFTELPVAFKPWCQSPAAYGDPYPRPESGESIRFYWTGRWEVEGPWQQIMVDVLDDLRRETAAAAFLADVKAAAESAKLEAARANIIATARASYADR